MLKLNTTEVTEKSVADLLRRYLDGERQRPLRSVTDTINFHNSPKERQGGETVIVPELNTHSFSGFALNDSQVRVLMMYIYKYILYWRTTMCSTFKHGHFFDNLTVNELFRTLY